MVGVGYALVLMAILKTRAADAASAGKVAPIPVLGLGAAFRSLLSTRGFLVLLAANALVGAAFWTIKNWLPVFFESELHVSQAKAGIFGTSFFNAAAFVGMLAGGAISDRWSRRLVRARALVPPWASVSPHRASSVSACWTRWAPLSRRS